MCLEEHLERVACPFVSVLLEALTAGDQWCGLLRAALTRWFTFGSLLRKIASVGRAVNEARRI